MPGYIRLILIVFEGRLMTCCVAIDLGNITGAGAPIDLYPLSKS